jgi:exopolysaccharide production protein ExoY
MSSYGDHKPAYAYLVVPSLSLSGGKRDAALIRTCDIVISLLAIVALLPLLALVALLVFLTNPGPIIFAHSRIGRGGASFPCFKFRSMVTDADARLAAILASDPVSLREWQTDHKLRNDPRITPIGKFLRKSSVDELPQLFNVLRGEMSIVGPRPIVQGEVPRYGRYYTDYCKLRPGITGLWQISGRNDVSYRRRVAYDVVYSRSCSFKLYTRIFVMTIPSVLLAKGSY